MFAVSYFSIFVKIIPLLNRFVEKEGLRLI